MEKVIHVGFGEYKISSDPDAVLVAFGVGSCVAVTLYDPVARLAGLLHVVLPSSNGKLLAVPGKYADSGIPLVVSEMLKQGARKRRLEVKLVGGAEILKRHYVIERLDIGGQNRAMCLQVLKKLGLRIQAEETGGKRGRTVRFHVGSGKVVVRQAEERVL